MKTFVILFAVILAASAQNQQGKLSILRHETNTNPDGSHSFIYETENGIYEDRQGYPKGEKLHAVQGQIQYVSPEGQVIYLTYIADENGFQPQGEHLPTTPKPR